MTDKITLDEVLAIRKEMYEKSTGIIQAKGHDYNRAQQAQGDTLFNMRVSTILGIDKSPEEGILTRLADKFMRLISLSSADPANKNESFEDTVVDIHNYIDYMVAFRREKAVYPFQFDKIPSSPEDGAAMRSFSNPATEEEKSQALGEIYAEEDQVNTLKNDLKNYELEDSPIGQKVFREESGNSNLAAIKQWSGEYALMVADYFNSKTVGEQKEYPSKGCQCACCTYARAYLGQKDRE